MWRRRRSRAAFDKYTIPRNYKGVGHKSYFSEDMIIESMRLSLAVASGLKTKKDAAAAAAVVPVPVPVEPDDKDEKDNEENEEQPTT